jgi:hypothetical protein
MKLSSSGGAESRGTPKTRFAVAARSSDWFGTALGTKLGRCTHHWLNLRLGV